MLLTVLGAMLAGLGLAMGWYGLRPLAVVPKLLRTDPVAPSAVSSGAADSFVVCRGTATPAESTAAGPFTGERCLGFEFEVSERQPFGIGIPWWFVHLDDGVATVPFRLQDDRGSVNVDPSSRRFSLDTGSTMLTVGARVTPPDRVREFVDGRADLPPVAGWLKLIPGMGTRRYVERRIDPGEEYVVARRTETRDGTTVLAGDLVISDRSLRGLVRARLKSALFPLFVASLFVWAGAVALLL